MQFKNKLCKIKANLKYKLAESFCRNFALRSRKIGKTILTVSIELKDMNSSWWKNSFNIFCEAKKWKCSNLSRQKSWIAVKLWRDWSQVIASFLEIKNFSSHSLMDCAVKQCIQHAYSRDNFLACPKATFSNFLLKTFASNDRRMVRNHFKNMIWVWKTFLRVRAIRQ